MLYLYSLGLFALPVALASPHARNNMVQHEQINSVPSGFVSKGPAPTSQMLKLRLALVQNNPKGLEEALMAVSSPTVQRTLMRSPVDRGLRCADPESVDAVTSFLSAHGITATKGSPAGDWLNIDVTVAQADALFDGQFTTFEHTASGTTTVRSLGYSIPASLKGHLDVVHPTITFPQHLNHQPVFSIPIPRSASPAVTNPGGNLTVDAVPPSCASVITPACLQALYGIPTTRATQASNVLGVSGFINQFANNADLRVFIPHVTPARFAVTTAFTLQTLDGGTNSQVLSQAGVEADLDIQYTIGVASGVPTTFISVGNANNDGVFGFLDIINFLLGESNPPHVLTTSYGANENGISQSVATNLCNAYAQLGARGTSILFASGDGGVSGSQSGACTTFVPTFPSGCPFRLSFPLGSSMTSVGATTGIGPESAAVSAYLTRLGSTNSGLFNRGGRAFPDIAAQGENVEIVNAGSAGLVAGTSCSSPIFASIIALLNDLLIAAGKPPLGFLNPFLYSAAGSAALTDITSGSNPGCGTNGFPATTGWDPVTGLGTPKFAALKTAVGL
ncbi:family S53 protease-like protein [Multifurca ochricompacta]|uniref:Family S53 protease-like protein n=1 Tax=Multifurca ochricompacta TaxID=376703 RepID=A0AAD4QJ84_9AGAM|nr:family S53 protease-like protein [Multifurca ochricompacta]